MGTTPAEPVVRSPDDRSTYVLNLKCYRCLDPAKFSIFSISNSHFSIPAILHSNIRVLSPLFVPASLRAVPHIHEKVDFTVAIFVVHKGQVLLIHHRKLDKWLPLGGHIE